jgi:hypothetical protein
MQGGKKESKVTDSKKEKKRSVYRKEIVGLSLRNARSVRYENTVKYKIVQFPYTEWYTLV